MFFNLIKKLASVHPPLRPPGAVSEKQFNKFCIRCRQCAVVCPYDAIEIAHAEKGLSLGTPYIFPAKAPCYLCEDFPCINVCPTSALEQLRSKEDVKMGLAKIVTDNCFAYNGIVCRSCYERCPIYRKAISLKEELYPVVNNDYCVGCGICEHVCPTEPKSIIVLPADF